MTQYDIKNELLNKSVRRRRHRIVRIPEVVISAKLTCFIICSFFTCEIFKNKTFMSRICTLIKWINFIFITTQSVTKGKIMLKRTMIPGCFGKQNSIQCSSVSFNLMLNDTCSCMEENLDIMKVPIKLNINKNEWNLKITLCIGPLWTDFASRSLSRKKEFTTLANKSNRSMAEVMIPTAKQTIWNSDES